MLRADEGGFWRRRRTAAAVRRGWYPRWLWPSVAMPATVWMLVLFTLPFYATMAVAAGHTDPLFGSPLPVWNPLAWTGAGFSEALTQLGGHSGIFYAPALRTLAYTVVATGLCLLIGYPVAYTVSRHAKRSKPLCLALLLAPFFISYLMRMLAWVNLLRPEGMVNRFLVLIHLPGLARPWLNGRPDTVILGLVYGYIPYMILPLFGSLDSIEKELLEAGSDLGGRRSEVFRRVTWPLSRQAVVAGTLIVALPITGDYYTNDLLSASPRTTMVANQIDFLIHGRGAAPMLGAAMVLLLMAVLMIPMFFYLRLVGEGSGEGDG